ncbi:MAG: alginate lyase family protein [Ilumatobacteraceae bacterium]
MSATTDIIGVAGPRTVVCVVDETRRDMATARDAVAGRFTHNGVTLDLGTRPDWRSSGLAHDVEWRTEWAKANEGLDLAHAYGVTGDLRFVSTWQELVTSYVARVPVGHDRSEVSARRMQNWLYAWQRFREAGAPVAPDVVETMTARLRADAAHLAAHLTPERNHRTLELYALVLVGLALDDRAAAAHALGLLTANAERDVLPDGVHRERSSDYHMIVLRSLVGAVANARAAGLAVPPALVDRTGSAATFGLHLQRPDGLTPALSDGDVGDFRPLLLRAGTLLDRPDLTWAATAGGRGTPPADRGASFPHGGYATVRSGWGDGVRDYDHEWFGVFDAGPLGDGGHGHYDHLAVELWGDGRPLVVDAGRYTYADGDDGWRRWFKGTAAHNTATVDGLDQTEYRPGKPKGPTSSARLGHRVHDGAVDLVTGTAISPRYDAVHARAVALVGACRWVVHDRLRAPTDHDYAVRWHLPPGGTGTATVTRRGGDHVVEAAGVRITVPGRCGDVTIEDGWISPAYGLKLPAPVVVVRTAGPDADVVTTIEAGS